MRRPASEHTAQPWRVHALATDFELLDVWRYPIRVPADIALRDVVGFLAETQSELVSKNGLAAMLFRLRAWLGRIFRWDAAPRPERREERHPSTSLRARLATASRTGSLEAEGDEEGSTSDMGFHPVYQTEDESLAEIQNATVHALMHLGRLVDANGDWSPQMAVYVKPRGLLGRVYMASISPFRHWIVYPAMMRAARRAWPDYLLQRGREAAGSSWSGEGPGSQES